MKYKNNELNFCDYCEVNKTNAKDKMTENKCEICGKYFCEVCNPDDYNHNGHIPERVRPNNICKFCYQTIIEAPYRDSSLDAEIAWGKREIKELHNSGSGSAIHLGNIMNFILNKHTELARQEVLTTLKELHKSSSKFLKVKLKN